MRQTITKIILLSLIPIAIYAICSFIFFNTDISTWSWWGRGIFAVWILIAINKLDNTKQ